MNPRQLLSAHGRQALNVVVVLALVAVVVPFVVYSVPQVAGAEASYVVLSGSMEPEISTGDVIVVYPVDPATVGEGDVITFARGNSEVPTTHRVVEVVETDSGRAFRTMGDANEDPDASLVRPEQVVGHLPSVTLPVVGEVHAAIPMMGYVVQFVNTRVGFATLVVVPFALLVLTEVWTFARRRRSGDGDGPAASADGDAAGAGDAGDADGAANAGDEADAPATYSVTTTDLRLALAVLVVLAGYSVVVAYVLQTAWAVAVAFGAVACALLVAGVKFLALGTVEPDAGGASATDGGVDAARDRVTAGSLDPELAEGPTVEVSSLDALLSMAAADDAWVVRDDRLGAHVLVDDDVVYVHEGEPADGQGPDDAGGGESVSFAGPGDGPGPVSMGAEPDEAGAGPAPGAADGAETASGEPVGDREPGDGEDGSPDPWDPGMIGELFESGEVADDDDE